jgi:hypothetical protein
MSSCLKPPASRLMALEFSSGNNCSNGNGTVVARYTQCDIVRMSAPSFGFAYINLCPFPAFVSFFLFFFHRRYILQYFDIF